MAQEERRRAPRIPDEGISIKLNMGGFDTVTHTLNISESGVYCKVDKEIPLMSRVRLVLMIPDFSKNDSPLKGLELDGVVVREHPVIIDGQTKHYDIAIFFENLSTKDKEIISNYISREKTSPL